MLAKKHLDEATAARALDAIERNAMMQVQLVEDILDVSRAVTGRLRLAVGPIDLAAVINDAVDSVHAAAELRNIRLEVTLDPSARHISGDAPRLQQVVEKLLLNAFKFTPNDGQVYVRLSRADSRVEINVTDTGAGIHADFLPHVFERFRQADGSTTRQHGGLGLGLSIVRHLVELHGGTVRADSEGEGKGSTFTVTLPAEERDEQVTPTFARVWP
jgi:signal transduction histidine kinase